MMGRIEAICISEKKGVTKTAIDKAELIENYGIKPGCNADIVILQARNPQEALRLKPARLFVIRRGDVIAETPEVVSRLQLGDQKSDVDFRWPKDSNSDKNTPTP